MNTGGAAHPEGVLGLRDIGEISEPSEKSRERDEVLLAAIAAALQGQPATPADPIPPLPARTDGLMAERWRQSGGALTGVAAPTDAATEVSTSSSTGAAEESRLVARIETPGMGTVCVVVDRSESGMKVVLAMNDASAVENANAERAALVQALEAIGLTVASVSVQRLEDGGISFAHVRDAHEARMFAASDGETTDGKPEGHKRRRLNLIG
jgi:hypothetical protein